MNKEPDMTERELDKLALKEWETSELDGSDAYVEMRLQSHHAAVMAKADLETQTKARGIYPNTETIAALDALILTPPVDPLVEEIRSELGPKFKHLAPLVAEEYRKDMRSVGGGS